MSKRIYMILVIIPIMILAACNHAVVEPNIRSVMDHETGNLLSLGERQSVFDRVLGQGELVPGSELSPVHQYSYLDDIINVRFYDGVAVEIFATSRVEGYERFEFYDTSWEMTDAMIETYFLDDVVHFRAFDAQGQELVQPFEPLEVYYVLEVINFYTMTGGQHSGMSIRITNQRFFNELRGN